MTIRRPQQLYLVRHGETAWSVSGQHTGRKEIPLTGNGEDQARKLGKHLQSVAFSHVLCSPRHRARQTCALAGLDKAVEVVADLAEWDYGDYEGRTSADIDAQRPDWNIFNDGCPNGETPAQILARADRLIVRLRQLAGHVALFSHGQFGAVLAVRWIGLPLAAAEHFPLEPASVSVLGYDPHHPGITVIETWNGFNSM
jgi:probable phosphoglycerate mutase